MKTNPLQENAETINKYLLEVLRGRPRELYQAASYLIRNGGKRLRPYLLFRCCHLLGGRTKDAMAAAGAIEMIHNFSLVHDDIMDNDEVRHGVPTTHNKFGLPLAILAGDVLFSKAYQVISRSGASPPVVSKLVSELSTVCVDICEGQQLDIKLASSKRLPTRQEYIEMIEKKTAALFSVSCSMGAICAGASLADTRNVSNFGANLGIAFQITDDLIGIIGEPRLTQKPVGNDLREGKKSLPILLALKKAKGKDLRLLSRSFGNAKSTSKDLAKAVDVIKNLGIEDEVRTEAFRYASTAKNSLKKYKGASKDELVSLLDFVVDRSL